MDKNSMLIPKPRYLGKYVWPYFFSSKDILIGIDQVVDNYAINPPYGVRLIYTGENSKICVLTCQDSSKWVLKQYQDTLNNSAILYNHSVLKHLNLVDFPAPRLQITRDGKDYLSIKGHNFALFEFSPGFRIVDYFIIPKSKKRYYIQQAGRILARFHMIMAEINPQGRKDEGYKTNSTSKRWDEYAWYRDEWNRLMPFATQKHNGTQLITIKKAQHISKILSKLAEEENNSKLPITVVHGDFGPLNLLYSPDGSVKTLLDFDKARFEERIEEVATSLIQFAGQPWGGIDLDHAQDFLNGYLQSNPLIADEIEQLPYALKKNRLRLLVWMVRKLFQTGSRSASNLFYSTLVWLDWLETEGRTILENFLAPFDMT